MYSRRNLGRRIPPLQGASYPPKSHADASHASPHSPDTPPRIYRPALHAAFIRTHTFPPRCVVVPAKAKGRRTYGYHIGASSSQSLMTNISHPLRSRRLGRQGLRYSGGSSTSSSRMFRSLPFERYPRSAHMSAHECLQLRPYFRKDTFESKGNSSEAGHERDCRNIWHFTTPSCRMSCQRRVHQIAPRVLSPVFTPA